MMLKNLDQLKQQKAEAMARVIQAIKGDDEAAFQKAFEEYSAVLEEAVLAEAKGLVSASDNQILAGRGVRVLTSEERDYYQRLAEAMRSATPQQALTNFNAVLPETIINAVFEDITEEHPLLSEIRFENAGALVKWLYSTQDGRHLATWGPLCGAITKQLAAQFGYIDLEQTKLSAWLPVCKAMLDLGPEWLDRYVRTMLAEALANGFENGIINGRGVATGAVDPDDRIYEPIGMIRDLTNFDLTTGYGAKVAVPIADFSPEVYGPLLAQLAVNANGLYRRITSVLLLVNPVDYFTKVLPATTYRNPDGTYNLDLFPFPTKIVQTAWLDRGTAVLGIGKNYLMAMGTGKGGKVEYSDEYKFLEDERTYLTKLYGTGRPIDNTSFLVLDISNLRPFVHNVRIVSRPDATLKALEAYGPVATKLDLTPAVFDANIHYYAAAFTNAAKTGKVVATATDPNAVVTATLNGVAQALNTQFNWADGQNVVIVTVTNGEFEEMYALVVTYTPEA
jgi:hypothetical protein